MKRQHGLLAVIILLVAVVLTGCGKGGAYKTALSLYESGNYNEAAVKFTELGDYENSKEMVKVCKYEAAKQLLDVGEYDAALKSFTDLGDYDRSSEYAAECKYQIMRQEYSAVFEALDGNVWYFNGGADTILNEIRFNQDKATISQVYFDGNGKHDNGSQEHSFTVDDQSIVVELSSGDSMKIAYQTADGSIKLGTNEYYTLQEIDAGMQGYWKERHSQTILGMRTSGEANIYFDHGHVKSESASLAAGGSNGEYYYYGPYEGSYSLNFGGLDTDLFKGNEWFFNIVNGEVTVLHYDRVCKPTNEFPGANGYSF